MLDFLNLLDFIGINASAQTPANRAKVAERLQFIRDKLDIVLEELEK
jgi:hypothetical protein